MGYFVSFIIFSVFLIWWYIDYKIPHNNADKFYELCIKEQKISECEYKKMMYLKDDYVPIFIPTK